MNSSPADAAKARETIWGLYPWLPGDDPSLVHPEDRERAGNPGLQGVVLQWVRDTPDGWAVLRRSSGEEYRVRPHNFSSLPTPILLPGTPVRTNETPPREGTIYALSWHFRQERYLYFVQVGAKFSHRQFYDTDLSPL